MADNEPSDFDNILKRAIPGFGDNICMKDPQPLPGLSLVQWMNMQQNSAVSSSLQPSYMHSLPGSILQNLPGGDIPSQPGCSAAQISQSNNAFNSQRLPQTSQQLAHFQKLPSTSSISGTAMQPQKQLGDITQQPQQNSSNPTLAQSQLEAQLLLPQNQVHISGILQQSIMGQSQQQNAIHSPMPDHFNQQLHSSDNHIQLQLLQKLQQQQQILLAQQSALQHPNQLNQIQDQQRQLVDVPKNFSTTQTSGQVLDAPPILQNSCPEANFIQHQMTTTNSQTNFQFSHLPQPPKIQQQQPALPSEISVHVGLPPIPTTNQHSATGSSLLIRAAGAGPSIITEDVPSCSTSPSTNNCAPALPPVSNSRNHRNTTITGDDMVQPHTTILTSSAIETMSSIAPLVKDSHPKSEVKPSLNISKSQNQGNFAPPTYLSGCATQMDYLDTSSSTTSVCLSQNETRVHQNNNPLSYNTESTLFRENSQDGEVQAYTRSNAPYDNGMDGQLGIPLNPDSLSTKDMVGLGKDFSNSFSSGSMLGNYENNRVQQELSSTMVSQAFGVPDMTFNSIDSSINDSSFLSRSAWAPPPPQPPQFQRMRTYTKVSLSLLLLF